MSRPDRRGFLGLAALGGAGMVAGCTVAAPGSRQERLSPPPPEGQMIPLTGGAVHALTAGSGPPVVLIHGAGASLRDWSFGPMARIAAAHQAIAFDRPGFGYSDPLPGDPADLFAQARHLRRALGALGHERAILVGHSYGGAVAMAWALDAPDTVTGLVLLGAAVQVWDGSPGLYYDILAGPAGGLIARLAPVLTPDRTVQNAVNGVFAPQPAPPGYVRHMRRDLLLDPETLRINAAQVAGLKDQLRPMVPRYGGLTMPVEILHGTLDGTVSARIHAEPLAAALPHARLTLLDGVGHMPQHVAPEAMLAAIGRLSGRA